MKLGDVFDPAMRREQVQAYLEGAGLSADEALLSRLTSWNALQAFVAREAISGLQTPPSRNSRLRTYGMEQDNPLAMLARHVVA